MSKEWSLEQCCNVLVRRLKKNAGGIRRISSYASMAVPGGGWANITHSIGTLFEDASEQGGEGGGPPAGTSARRDSLGSIGAPAPKKAQDGSLEGGGKSPSHKLADWDMGASPEPAPPPATKPAAGIGSEEGAGKGADDDKRGGEETWTRALVGAAAFGAASAVGILRVLGGGGGGGGSR